MPTNLSKDVVRESNIEVGSRKIIITLTANQEISMKLKGMKSGHVVQSISDLYRELTGETVEAPKEEKATVVSVKSGKPTKGNPSILLSDLRSQALISDLDYGDKVKFEALIKSVIQNM